MQSQGIKPVLQRLAASALASTAFVFGALAADWTVSTNTSLYADTTVEALTVEYGVTLDLNGYNLTCSSIAGAGRVESRNASDLTSPDTDGTHVTWSTNQGEDVGSVDNLTTAANLFNNSTPSLEDSSRIQVGTTNLPLTVTYDFGEGAKRKIVKYKMYCYRASSKALLERNRCPRAWTFEGSNDNVSWTVVDSQSGVTWAQGSSPKEFSFCNDAAYRYYRITITASGTSYLELNQLEYFQKSELRMNVPEGVAVDVPSVSSSFTNNVNFVTEVNGGTVNLISDFDVCYNEPTEGVMTVNDGCVTYTGGNLILYVGNYGKGTLTINGGLVDVYSLRCGYMTGANGIINLNDGTLRTRRIYTGSSGMGSLVFNGGTLEASAVDPSAGGLISAATTVTVDKGGGTIDTGAHDITIGAKIGGAGAMRFRGGGSITLSDGSDYSGGTTIELGTKIIMSYPATRSTILRSLVIDGDGLTESTAGIPVFQSQSSSALTSADLANITFVNCGQGSAARIDGNSIVVDYVAPCEWKLTADATWSELVAAHGTPAEDTVVTISATDKHVLTIDTDVAIAKLVFTGVNPVVVVDASAITAEELKAAENGISIVTVQPSHGDIAWRVVNSPIPGTRVRWIPDYDGATGSLRLLTGTILIFR